MGAPAASLGVGLMTVADWADSPHAHDVAFYDHDSEVVDLVADHVAVGLALGERVVLIVTDAHRAALDEALLLRAVDPHQARRTGSYLTLDAAETLAAFMVDGMPDRERYMTVVGGVIDAARADGSTVRAFGEMVALLWADGNVPAAIALEALWNELAEFHQFTLLCAYPTAALDGARLDHVDRVCELHSSVLPPRSYDLPVAAPDTEPAVLELSGMFLPVPAAVPAARRFVTAVLAMWGADEVAWEAGLVTSELATNAVRHGQSAFRLFVSRPAGAVRIAIEDVAAGWPSRRDATLDDVDGRGVAIVEALSSRWGCDARLGSKVAWAEIPDPTTALAAARA